MTGGLRFGQDQPGARARLVRRVVYVVIGALLGLASGMALSSTQPQRYESTMQLLVGPVGADRSTLDASGLLSRTYADLLTSRNAISRAADSLGVTVVDGDVTAIADDKSRVILLVVQSENPTTPPRLATTLAADLIVLVEGSQQEEDPLLDERAGPGQVRVLDNATDPARPLSRVPVLSLFGTVLVGAGVGLALGTLAPRSRRRPVDRQYLELIGLKVISLAQVTNGRRFRSRESAKQIVNKRDEYELVFQQLLIACAQLGPFRTIMFVPAAGQVEKDSAQLMLLLAQAGRRLSCTVELADVDPDNPLLIDVGTRAAGVDIISLGNLDTESGVDRITRLTEMSVEQLLFLATPSVGSSIRALTGAAAVDRVVVVARSGETERRDVRGLLDDLESLNVKPAVSFELGRGDLMATGDQGSQPAPSLVAATVEDTSADSATTAVIGLVEAEEASSFNGDGKPVGDEVVAAIVADESEASEVLAGDELDELLADDFDTLFDDVDRDGDGGPVGGSDADDSLTGEIHADDFDALFAEAAADVDGDGDGTGEARLDDDDFFDLADDELVDEDDDGEYEDLAEDELDDEDDDVDEDDDGEYEDLADDELDDEDDDYEDFADLGDDDYDDLDDDYEDFADDEEVAAELDVGDAADLAGEDAPEVQASDDGHRNGNEEDPPDDELTSTPGASVWKL